LSVWSTPQKICKAYRNGGFSEALLKNHFTLYQGYVTNTNKVLDILEQMLKETCSSLLIGK
jgi:hypothetical protein